MMNKRKRRPQAAVIAARYPALVAMLRRTMIVLLPAWLAYFLAITLSAKRLNSINLPLIDIPLANWLVIQGSLLAFAIMLIVLARAATVRA